ncbi:MAG TPA: hypothetical protein VMU07_00915 [Candidatus Paceibacterota bacterium]|nr:hypothetical protein [Candidatus Paceibacterota bacterium]
MKKYFVKLFTAAFAAMLIVPVSLFVAPQISFAQTTGASSITITPPFFTVNMSPGDAWASSIRVVNTNPGTLPIVAVVNGFSPAGDTGQGTFTKLSDLANDQDALANWITVSPSPFNVPSGGAIDVPFSVAVPKDAAPGGHYAAILIGTQPGGSSSGSYVGVSSFISALIFVRVSGDVKESGAIQEFSTDKNFYQDPNVNFTVRFANNGNVHVRPSGQIEIYNAFGKQVGNILVNQQGNLGYVLPSSTRKFSFNWEGSNNLWDIGEYTAVVTLAYGTDGSKSVSGTVTFWVLPIWKLLEDIFALIIVIGIFVWLLKRYIRTMLEREMGKYGPSHPSPRSPASPPPPPPVRHNREQNPAKPSETIDLRRKNEE